MNSEIDFFQNLAAQNGIVAVDITNGTCSADPAPSRKTNLKREEIVKLWRKYGSGRLYWRDKNGHWRDWEKDAVAMAKKGPVRVWFMTSQAILDEIEQIRMYEESE